MILDRCAWVNFWQGCLQSHAPDKLAILEGACHICHNIEHFLKLQELLSGPDVSDVTSAQSRSQLQPVHCS